MTGLIIRAGLAIFFVFLGLSHAIAAKRVALVIGNSSYQHVTRLPNPANDATDIAAALKRLGFDVRKESNLNYGGLRRALRDFSRLAARAEFAIVYYAGHGMEVNKHNYVIPVDAELKSDLDIEYEAVPLDLVMNAVDGARKLKLVLLDSCRNNPFAASMKMASGKRSIGRGLARVEPEVGTLVSFAAKEGTTADDGEGRNSPYTAALLQHLEEPGLEINFLFRKVRDSVMTATNERQQPFTYGSLPGKRIYLSAPVAANGALSGASSDLQKQLDELRKKLQQKDESAKQVDELRKQLAKRDQSALKIAELTAALARQQAEFEKLKQQADKANQKLANLPLATKSPPTAELTSYELYRKGEMAAGSGGYERAVEFWRRAAARGHTGAYFKLGEAYELGRGVAKSISAAKTHYRSAMQKGSSSAKRALARLEGNSSSAAGSFKANQKLANLPSATKTPTTTELTSYELYRKGEMAAGSGGYERAVEFWQRAAEKGHTNSYFRLGEAYELGRGVGKNLSVAKSHYRKAMQKGSSGAGRALARLEQGNRSAVSSSTAEPSATATYRRGESAYNKKNYGEALRLFREAADKGNANAMNFVGYMYSSGHGVSRNYREAARWYRKAVGKGHAAAMSNLANRYVNGQGVPRNYAEAHRLYRKALDGGYVQAMVGLSYMYNNGHGVPVDRAEAVRWMARALKQGDKLAVKYMTTQSKHWSRSFRKDLQKILRDEGYYNGSIDGVFGSGTVRAIKRYAGKG